MAEDLRPASAADLPSGAGGGSAGGRSLRKRTAIMAAATALFLEHGYQATSMDDIASLAAVSKPTVYKHFADKEGLFVAIVLDTLGRMGDPFRAEVRALEDTGDLARDLRALARRYLATVMTAEVLRLRRLVIGEAGRLPQLARAYHARAVDATLDALAVCFAKLAARGLLRVDDPSQAADDFAFLVIGRLLDKALFSPGLTLPAHALDAQADAGVRVFLAAYAVGG